MTFQNKTHNKNTAGWLFITVYIAFEILPAGVVLLMDGISETYAYTLISLASVQAVMLGAVLIFSKVTHLGVLKHAGLNRFPNIFQILLLAAMSVTCIYAGNNISTLFVSLLAKTGMRISLIEPRMDNAVNIIFSVTCIGMMPAFCEELFIRQGMLSGLRRNYPPYKAILISALFFSLMHTNAAQSLHQFFLGATLAAVVVISRSIWSGIIFHFFNNLYILLVYSISPERATVDYMNMDIGADKWLIATLIFILGYAVIFGLLILFSAVCARRRKANTSTDVDTSENDMTTQQKSRFFNTRIGSFLFDGWSGIRSLSDPVPEVEQPVGNGLVWSIIILLAIWILVFVNGFIPLGN